MGRRDLRKATQRKPKTKGAGDRLIDYTIKDLDRRNKNLQEQLELYRKQILHGMDATPHEVKQPKRKGITKLPSQEERWKQEELEVQKALGQDAEGNPVSNVGRNWQDPEMGPEQPEINFDMSDSNIARIQHKTTTNLQKTAIHKKYMDDIAKLDASYTFSDAAGSEITANLTGDSQYKYLNEQTNSPLESPYKTIQAADQEAVGEVPLNSQNMVDAIQSPVKESTGANPATKKADYDFLTKSNNAAAKSGVFEDEELLALRDKHQSGEWRKSPKERHESKVDIRAGTGKLKFDRK